MGVTPLVTLPPLLRVESSSYRIIIPEDVERKIRFYCSNVSTIEWSGILFYTVDGTFKDNNLVVICKDIFLMDIGTSGYTEFNMSPEVANYMAENIELCDCYTGLIHSHNTMPTFFSGTDTRTLNIEGNDRNHFVSLIVNNVGKYTAAITRKIEYIATKSSYKSFEDKEIVDSDFKEVISSKIEYFDLKVEIEGITSNDMEERLAAIKERKAKTPATIYTPTSGHGYYGSYGSTNNYYGNDTSKYDYEEENSTGATDKLPNYTKENSSAKSPISSNTVDNKTNDKYIFSPIEEKELNTALKQLVTGSIVLSSDSKLDITKWVNSSMESVFDKRFGDTKSGFEAFTRWATDYVDFILWDLIDTYSGDIKMEEDQMISDCAISLISLLEELPKSKTNKYIITLIDIINGYC